MTDDNLLKDIEKTLYPHYKFYESSTLSQALQNLQSQIANLVNTYRDIIFDKYLLMSYSLDESEKDDLTKKVKELNNDFKNVLQAMRSVYTKLKDDQPRNGNAFKRFVDKQSDEVLDLYNDCIVESVNENLTKLLQDMYFMFDMCFRAINTELQQYNVKNTNKIPLVKTFKQPETYNIDVNFITILKDVFEKGQKLFQDMRTNCK